MKKLYLPIIAVAALLMSSCGGSPARSGFESFSKELCEQENLSFTSRVRAEYDDRCAEFTLAYTADSEGCTITVVSPEIIRGVSAHVRAGETALEYGGVILDTGMLDGFGLSPMSALPVMVEAMKTAYIDSAWEADGQLAAMLAASDELNVEVHLDKYTKTPVSAELSSNGRVRVFAEISGWTYVPAQTGETDTVKEE